MTESSGSADATTSQNKPLSSVTSTDAARNAVDFAAQAEKLSYDTPTEESPSVAVRAAFVTPHDPVIISSDGGRLPGVPLREAHKLNVLREELREPRPETVEIKEGDETKEKISNTVGNRNDGIYKVIRVPTEGQNGSSMQKSQGQTLQTTMPPSHSNPLFPPLPLYGPPSALRNVQCFIFRVTSFFLSLAFLGSIVVASLISSIPRVSKTVFYWLTFRDIRKKRPFYAEEQRKADLRKKQDREWVRRLSSGSREADQESTAEEYPPTEGGLDPIKCDVGYYARRVGLDVETFQVQTEDGFIIELWHVFDPKDYSRKSEEERKQRGPTVFQQPNSHKKKPTVSGKKPRYPVLLVHGLLQSAGAYCCNDDDSLAFWLCKSGYDVWLGNNRCGFKPKHDSLTYGDPRMWCWNIRQMGVFDLAALTSRVLSETGFDKLGLVCHSQGTTEALVALSKDQRPELGERLSVFCGLAPAAYAGPLIDRMYFRFMRLISPAFFRIMFGIHSFIPFMMQMHGLLPPRPYGWLGYKVLSFLFNWSDTRWDRGLRNRMFQFSPVYVSAESMRWWLGRECFAKHKCILSTKETMRAEDGIDGLDATGRWTDAQTTAHLEKHPTGSTAWYNEQAPPFAFWVGGADELVDGRKLLRRFANGREPHVTVVHGVVIDNYEHLDVMWAMDAPEQVFKDLREVLWRTCNVRDECRVPTGCEDLAVAET